MSLDLGKQVGPLPLGAWVAVVGVGLGIAYYTRQGSANAAAATGTATPDASLDPNSPDAVGAGVNGQWLDVSPPTSPSPQVAPTDNDEWGRRAINGLIAFGYSPALAQSAITNALQGNAMSAQEYALWTVALAKFGAPPNAVDIAPPVNIPGPVKPPTVHHPSTGPTSHKVKRGGVWRPITSGSATLGGLSKLYYGTGSHADDIYQANRKGARRPGGTRGFLTSPNESLKHHRGRSLYIPVIYV